MNKFKRKQNERPQAFWGALIGAGTSLVGGLLGNNAAKKQAKLMANQNDYNIALQDAQSATNAYNAALDYQQNYLQQFKQQARLGITKRLGGRNIMITDGGNAKRIGNNTYLLRGGSHEDINETGQTGIGINVGGNEIEAEGGEVAQRKGNSLRIYSAQPILGGISPAQAIMRGYNKDKVFNAQQRFKKNNGIKDDGSKARNGGYYDWAKNTSSNLGISFIDPTYDYRAYYNSITPYERNLIRFAPQGTHFTDIGKTTNHPTFSNESKYSNKKTPGGTWNGNVFVPAIWQFGNNGNAKRNKYMKGSGEGYFDGRKNVYPKRFGGLTSKDRGSSKHPYSSVSSKDFAGGNRSYPIPTKADAIDALRLAGLHGRSDVRSKVYSKYPELRKKADFGTWVRSNRNNNALANLLYESGLIDKEAWRGMLRDIHTFTGMGSDPYDDNQDEAVVAPGFSIVNKAQILRNVQQANRIAQASRASQTAQRTSYAAKQAKDFYRDLGINIPIGRSQTYNPAFRSSALARNIEDSNKALQMSLHNTHLPKGIRLTPIDQSSIGRTAARVINPREAEIVRTGIPIGQSARNMTSGANPFLYAERTPSQVRAGLNRAFGAAKQGVKNASQKVKDFGNKVRNSNTYRTRTGFGERYNPTLGAYEQYNTYGFKPWVKGAAGTAGVAGVIGLGVGLSNTKNEDAKIKAQLDAYGKPISPYIARRQESTKSQAKKVAPARRDTTRTDTTKQVNKVVKRQVRTTPQYTGNTTRGNYQLHDGETKTINGVKYTRRGNTIINHKTNVGYIYDKNGNYTGQADYSKVGNFNQAFDAARAAGRSQFIYHAGKYQNYSTNKETDAKKEALNRRVGARRIAKRMGGLTNPPVERFKCGGHIRPKAEDGMLAPIYYYGTNKRRLPSFAPIDVTPRAIPNFKPVSATNTKAPFDPNSVPFLGRQSSFKPATQDYIGLGIDTLAALGSGLINYNSANKTYLPERTSIIQASKLPTYYNISPQVEEIRRQRNKAFDDISHNTSSSVAAINRMNRIGIDSALGIDKLYATKENEENKMLTQDALNQQSVAAENAKLQADYEANKANILNAQNQAKADAINLSLSGLSQAWTNFAGSVEQRYDNRQKEAIIAATAKDPAVLSNAVQFGYNFSPEVLAAIYNSTDDDNLKSLALSQLSTKNKLRYGIR